MKPSLLLTAISASALLSLSASTMAATDLSGTPLANTNTTQVKPNIMFIMDNSFSMSSEFLPESVSDNNSKNCYRNHYYNRLYFNPNADYDPPVDSTGAAYPPADFASAKTNGFDSGSSVRDLRTNFKTGNDAAGQAAYYYEHSGTPTPGTCYANAQYTKRVVPDGLKQKFANWYSYYRTRLLAMKTSAGFAFKEVSDEFRVGFTTIGYTGITSSDTGYQSISDFNSSQKEAWYEELYGTTASTSTPLRGALSKVGQLYGGKHGGNTIARDDDPVQYSCQQNFAILSTDGYWNITAPESSTYGPFKLDGTTAVGNQDGTGTDRPMLDGRNQSNTLADVAMYYYNTDLRPSGSTGALGTDVSENNVSGSGKDDAHHQHMTTFTLGFGVAGTMNYAENYESGGSSDYTAILQGTRNWPDVYKSTPAPNCNTIDSCPERVDDLWHAAVNGRGLYLGASDSDSLVSSIKKILTGVQAKLGAGAAAATSSLEPVAGNNFAYVASYRTQFWDGMLEARTIDLNTGAISSTVSWDAQSLLTNKVSSSSDTRTIYKFDSTQASKLNSFTWANLTATEKAYFNDNIANLSQYTDLTAGQVPNATGQNLLNFIRGRTGFQDDVVNPENNRVFRSRINDGTLNILGDIINAQPLFVGPPVFGYEDTDYTTFKTAQAGRTANVYVAANDGMLHAFDATNGTETWAYIPPMAIPNLWILGDKNYSALHRYLVDGSPVVGDAYIGGAWKTILVGGMNKGGRGFYALDITNPASPRALWNFTSSDDSDVGYSFGNPVITKRVTDGKWVVLLTSGYNNTGPGTGKGYLFVLDAENGTVLSKISTDEGDTSNPSGLSRISSWTDNGSTDNTTRYVYGGDLNGSLWRFDLSDDSVLKMASLASGGVAQPISTRPELGLIGTNRVVLVGTGQLLGVSDLVNNAQQSFYAIKDTNSSLGDVRASGLLVQQSVTTIGDGLRSTTTNPVDWGTNNGWFIDLPENVNVDGKGSERVNVDPQLHFGTLLFVTNVPNANACTTGGDSWRFQLNYKSGQYISTSLNNAAASKYYGAFSVGLNVVRLPNGKVVVIDKKSNTDEEVDNVNEDPSSGAAAHRVSWRELFDLENY